MPEASTDHEIPLFLAAGQDRLFAVLTEPVAEPDGTGVVFVQGAGIAAFGNARVSTALARELAASGHHALRIDQQGTGESTVSAAFDFDSPQALAAETAAACLRERGASRIVLVAECFGARGALAAVNRGLQVDGLVLLFPPLTAATEAETDREARETAAFLAELAPAVEAGVPMFVVYGEQDLDWPRFDTAMTGRFGPGYRSELPALSVRVEPGKLHGIASAAARAAVREQVLAAITEFRKG
ncbi:alpha/beta hydrolase [Crossiella sp. NPDC003009]